MTPRSGIENVLEPAVQMQHGETVHQRPDTRDAGRLRQGQMIQLKLFVTTGGDDAGKLGKGRLGGLLQHRLVVIEPLGAEHQLEHAGVVAREGRHRRWPCPCAAASLEPALQAASPRAAENFWKPSAANSLSSPVTSPK